MSRSRPARRPPAVPPRVALVAGVLLMAVGGVPSPGGGEPAGGAGHVRDAGALPEAAGVGRAAAGSPPVALAVDGGRPAPVTAVGSGREGALHVPEAPRALGWWALGARPGQDRGTVLLAGHVDTPGGRPGPFAALGAVPLGTEVEVASADGSRHRYRITARRTYRARGLPADLFAATGPARLALATCAGRFGSAAGVYDSTLVLYGRPTGWVSPG